MKLTLSRSAVLLACAFLATTCILVTQALANGTPSAELGAAPTCAYGYYPSPPYNCAPEGYYGQEWFPNGVFVGAGPWYPRFIEAGADRVILHKDQPLVLRSKQAISSRANKVGDALELEVIRPVMAGNLVIIAKGAPAYATVEVSQRAGRRGRGGVLGIYIHSVQLVTGQKIPVVCHFKLEADNASLSISNSAAMGGAGASLAEILPQLLHRGQEAKTVRGTRIPAWIAADASISTADLAANQPAPRARSDAGYIYLFMDAGHPLAQCKFLVGESHYFLLPSTAVRLEVPPGEYWLRTGRAAKDDNISKTKLADLTRIPVQGGESYYLTCDVDNADTKNAFLRTVAATQAEEHIDKAEALWDSSVTPLTPETLRKLQAQPLTR